MVAVQLDAFSIDIRTRKMPSRGNYEVTSREEGKAAERDQSYRSCILSMLIFIILSIVLILASLPWKSFRQNRDLHNDPNSPESAKVEGHGFGTERSVEKEEKRTEINRVSPAFEENQTTQVSDDHEKENPTTMENSVENEKQTIGKNVPFEGFSITEPTTKIDTGRWQQSVENDAPFDTNDYGTTENSVQETRQTVMREDVSGEEYADKVTTFEIPDEKKKETVEINDVSLERFTSNEPGETSMASTGEKTFRKMPELPEEAPTTLETITKLETTESRIIDNSVGSQAKTTSSESFETTKSRATKKLDEKWTTRALELLRTNETPIMSLTRESRTTKQSDDDHTSLQRLLVAKYFGNESTSSTTEDTMEKWLDEVAAGTTNESTELPTKIAWTKIVSSLKSQTYTNPVIQLVRTTRAPQFTTPRNSIEKATVPTFQNVDETKMNICETGSCKQLASKILSYMNHSADPCDDFYEFACGGLEADQQISDRNLKHRVLEKIEGKHYLFLIRPKANCCSIIHILLFHSIFLPSQLKPVNQITQSIHSS